MKFAKSKIGLACVVGCVATLSLITTSSLTSCSSSSTTKYLQLYQLVPYLHYIEFNNYKLEDNLYDQPKPDEIDYGGGCSCVRNGDLFGRNLDYYYDETPYFVVRVNGNKDENRLSSIGITLNKDIKEEDITKIEKIGSYDSSIENLPNKTVDGINECGVVCAVNVCNLEDAGDYGHPLHNKSDLNLLFSIRYILDHAHSAEEAITLLKGRNLYIDTDRFHYNAHMMIADAKETYIVEFFNKNGWKNNPDHSTIQPRLLNAEDDKIMTNFYVNMSDDRIKQTWKDYGYEEPKKDPSVNKVVNFAAQGTERYDILKGKYESTNTFGGMYEALRSAWMSNIYPAIDNPHWPSEDLWQNVITDKTKFDSWKVSNSPNWDGEGTPGYKYLYNDYHRIMQEQNREEGREHDIWITNHTAIFNIKDKTMWLVPEEHYSLAYTYKV